MKQLAGLIISGDVQGIGYRYFARNEAHRLGLTGWTRNNTDGTVECEVEGEKENIEKFIQILRSKHPWARVDSVKITWIETKSNGKYSDFFIK
ncbi:MAG: acylphosphatase [Elusimicrobiota bacterium]